MNVPPPMSGSQLPQPPARQRRLAGVDQVHLPRLDVVVERRDLAVLQRDRHVLADRVVVEEVALDLIALVAERQHELVEAVPRVVLHDVPEDRPAADLDERLRPHLGLLGQARARAAAQNHDRHCAASATRNTPCTSQSVARSPASKVNAGAQPSTVAGLGRVEILIADLVATPRCARRARASSPSPRGASRPAPAPSSGVRRRS